MNKKLLVIFLLLAVLGSFLIVLLRKNYKKSYPDGLTFTSNVIDVGNIYKGDFYQFDFKLENLSNQTIEMRKITPDCSCTEVNFSSQQILPGEKCVLNGSIRFDGISGKQSKRIVLETTDDKQYIFTVNANVVDSIIVSPPLVDFGNVWTDDTLHASVTIESYDTDHPLELLEILPGNHNSLKASVVNDGNNKWHTDIEITTPYKGGYFQRILVNTNNPRLSIISIPIKAFVSMPMNVEPQAFCYGSISPGIVSCKFTINRRPGFAAEVNSVETRNIKFTLKDKIVFENDTATVDIDIDLSDAKKLVRDYITIKTSMPEIVLYVPIVAYIE